MRIGNRPFETPLVKNDALLCLYVCAIQMTGLQMEVAKNFLTKLGES